MLVQGFRLRAVTNTVNRTEDAPKMEQSLRVKLPLTVTMPGELRVLSIADSPFQARTRLEPLFPTSSKTANAAVPNELPYQTFGDFGTLRCLPSSSQFPLLF